MNIAHLKVTIAEGAAAGHTRAYARLTSCCMHLSRQDEEAERNLQLEALRRQCLESDRALCGALHT
jgi:hypothetical protein